MSARKSRLSSKIKISSVSYSNSYPFIYGLEKHPVNSRIELRLDNPAECANKLLSGEVDLGLVPVAILPELKDYHIISDYCIGADGPVETVCLFSEVPLDEIDSILLDYQSRTSVQLVQFLAANYWNIKPNWIQAEENFIDHIKGSTAGVVIGDRAFPLLSKYPVLKDLSEEWKKHTKLPFVFACWVSNRKLDSEFTIEFNDALRLGLSQKRKAISELSSKSDKDLVRYVENVISYNLDAEKREAMKLFMDWISSSKKGVS